jgi:DNA-binding transcriptional LysR family regulator
MHTLEMQAGGPLFSRSRFGVKPTLLGESLAREGRAITQTLHSAQDAISRHRMGLNNLLRVGVGPLIGMGITAKLAHKLMQQLPQLTLTVNTDRPQNVVEQLIDGEVDIAIAPAVYAQSPVGIARVLLAEDTIGVYCGPGHPLVRAETVSAEALNNCDWINVGTSSPFQSEQLELLARNGVSQHRTRFATFNDAVILLDFLWQGHHLAVLPSIPLMLMRDRYPFVEIPMPQGKSRRDLYAWCREESMASEVVKAFIHTARAIIESHKP